MHIHFSTGVKAFDKLACLPMHYPQEHDVQQFRAYHKLNELVQYPDRFVESSIQQQVVYQVRSQFSSCAKAVGVVLEHNESISTTTHSPGFSLDLVPDKRPSKNLNQVVVWNAMPAEVLISFMISTCDHSLVRAQNKVAMAEMDSKTAYYIRGR